jgi:hypothetical protein
LKEASLLKNIASLQSVLKKSDKDMAKSAHLSARILRFPPVLNKKPMLCGLFSMQEEPKVKPRPKARLFIL